MTNARSRRLAARPFMRLHLSPRSLFFCAVVAVFATLSTAPALAQGQIDRDHRPSRERVSILERRQSDIDGNNVRATIFNFGQTGRTGGGRPTEIPWEWPKNTRRHYIALTGVFVGAEVQDETGATVRIVDVPNYRSAPGDANRAWTFAPVSGYVNASAANQGLARSDASISWPPIWPDKMNDPTDPGWPGSWNGYFGKNVFNADQEVFYKMGDDQYDRFAYYPDSTDRSRRGLGIISETRVLAWSQVLVQDAVFILHSVKNDGTKDLGTVGVTLWIADLVGGDGDSDDDTPRFNLLLDTAFLGDRDGIGNEAFGNSPVGAAIVFFLETPGNARDRIDNDGDGTTRSRANDINNFGMTTGEPGSPVITLDLIRGEGDQAGEAGQRLRYDGIDNNLNGLVDEDSSYARFGQQVGVGFADGVDNDGDGEPNSPVVTQAMIDLAANDEWRRWPVNPQNDPIMIRRDGSVMVHLTQVGPEDLGKRFKDGIDNDGDGLRGPNDPPIDYLWESGSPLVSQEMIDVASQDAPYFRYRVPGTDIVLFNVVQAILGLPYADGIDNDGDGAVDEGIDEWIDEMIDESRDDGIDNDGDWRVLLDDVGIDGIAGTGSIGEGDGLPTSGAGTGLPGEPNIDVTDVSESDQIGITNVQYRQAGGTQLDRDFQLFQRFMIPGQFVSFATIQTGDYDLFVSSGIFPLRAGQTERVSYAVILGEANYAFSPDQPAERYAELLRKRVFAQEAYEQDYRFAQAPICPTVTAVPGDGAVTLYWDEVAESSFDTFIANLGLGLDPYDFEGYKVYRATDPAFLDARVITDAFGNRQFLRPIAQYDLINEYGGFFPLPVGETGTLFYLGPNTRQAGAAANGLAHSFADSTVTNGVTYYYAVTSYDHGALAAQITPSECPIRIRINPNGSVETGDNVVRVVPSQRAAGTVDAAITNLTHVQGSATGEIGFRILDPVALRDGHTYRVTFADTLIAGLVNAQGLQLTQDTITTKSFTLRDLTGDRTLLENSRRIRADAAMPVIDGFQIRIFPDLFTAPIPGATRWQQDSVYPLTVQRYSDRRLQGIRFPSDYEIEVGSSVGFGQSTQFSIYPVFFQIPTVLPSVATNFRIWKLGPDGNRIAQVSYAFRELIVNPGEQPGQLSMRPSRRLPSGVVQPGETDRIIILEQIDRGSGPQTRPTWSLGLDENQFDTAGFRQPASGDVGTLATRKPFLRDDIYEFTVRGPSFDAELAADAMSRIRVVPNPYVATNIFEPLNFLGGGRGERVIRFTNLPPQCTIRIYTVSGRLVTTLEHNVGPNDEITPQTLMNGTAIWDVLSDDRLSVSYGVYLYHIDAPGVGTTTGTIGVIK
ncbi:hypothetical protein BH23BAC4_BH23BAC4_02680 [soil metagenome]